MNVDLKRLRLLLREQVGNLKDTGTGTQLPALCERLGLAPLGDGVSKRDRLEASVDATDDGVLGDVAARLLALYPLRSEVRDEIQEILWAGTRPEIPLRYRRDAARAISGDDLFHDSRRFDALISSLFDVDDDPLAHILGKSAQTLRARVDRHVFRNPGDWSAEQLFDALGAFECSSPRFARLLEGMASAEVRPDEQEQRRFVERVNGALRPAALELRETGNDGGYPSFTVVSAKSGTLGRPKNLIFASSVKPDLRFSDAVSNSVEVVTNAERVLIYDRPIGVEGLRWSDLQAWWAEREGHTDEDRAKKTLFARLRECLPKNSPPQQRVFTAYYRALGSRTPHMPALVPEVWLHWDPKTVAERGVDALGRSRMDFLLLLPGGVRVVLEVDGQQHYADEDGRASPSRYAEMVALDRDLRLFGYEVYRFGGAELSSDSAADVLVADFVSRLFRLHRLQ